MHCSTKQKINLLASKDKDLTKKAAILAAKFSTQEFLGDSIVNDNGENYQWLYYCFTLYSDDKNLRID